MITFIFDNDIAYAEQLKEIIQKSIPECTALHINAGYPIFADAARSSDTVVVIIDTGFKSANSNFLQFARRLRDINPLCHICFTSNSTTDMVFCYKKLIRPSGFFIKPVDEDELKQLYNEIKTFEKNKISGINDPKIMLKCKNKSVLLKMSEILYFTAIEKKIFCYTVRDSELSFYSTLNKIENDYKEYLLRCHSGFLVNKNKIIGISKNEMMLQIIGSKQGVPISKSRYKNIEEFIKSNSSCDFMING